MGFGGRYIGGGRGGVLYSGDGCAGVYIPAAGMMGSIYGPRWRASCPIYGHWVGWEMGPI